MAITIGQQLGSYEITALIGKGGMGEVYRARDMKLKREVAIKILPEQFSRDNDRVSRFQREAEVLAALNHPNIAAIYDLEHEERTRLLVMELVEGETLAERIARAPIPCEEAIAIGIQICEGLEAAHERGIIHRDLKPANIKITPNGSVKILDLGLAVGPIGGDLIDPNNSPTLTIAATQPGMIMGTAPYMSPEQASGRRVDKRSDIWSFGVVLWEMLTGNRLFPGGETVSHILADVLRADIDFTKLPDHTPQSVRELLERCLDRNLKTRLRDIGEARIALQRANNTSAPAAIPVKRGKAGKLVAFFAAVVALMFAAIAVFQFRAEVPQGEPIVFQIEPPEDVMMSQPTISPNGRRLAFVGTSADGVTRLWVRSLEDLEMRPLSGSEGALAASPHQLFWSPDSRSIAFDSGGRIKKVQVSGGPPVTICDVPNGTLGLFWSADNKIVFGLLQGGLAQVDANGGTPAPVTRLDPSGQEQSHAFPWLLPDGRHFLYVRRGSPTRTGIYVGTLDSKPDAQLSTKLLPDSNAVGYVSAPDGRGAGMLLLIRENTLVAQPFDSKRLTLAGEAAPVVKNVSSFSVSSNGVLTYSTEAGGVSRLALTWFDRSGKPAGAVGEPGPHNMLALSRDGTQLAEWKDQDIWVTDMSRGASRRLTYETGNTGFPSWSPDGKYVAFSYGSNGPYDLYRKLAVNGGSEELLYKSSEPKNLNDWSRDGRLLLYSAIDPNTKSDLWVIPVDGRDHMPIPVARTPFAEVQGQFSPDGNWVAYVSDESGRPEVYVRALPQSNGISGGGIISQGGGYQPRWRSDGKELFYFSPDRTLMSVNVTTGPHFDAGVPMPLFRAPAGGAGATTNVHRWDVAPHGDKFLITTFEHPGAPSGVTVIVNWQAGLKK